MRTEIRNLLRLLEKRAKELPLPQQIEKVQAALLSINKNLAVIEEEIKEVAQEEKEKPWIDARFDFRIDQLVLEEIQVLQKLKQDFQSYADLASTLATTKDVSAAIELLQQELQAIERRNELREKEFEEMETETLRERLARTSASVPPQQTNDDVPWNNIAHVVRELGGWIVDQGGRHPVAALFPASKRPIPFSGDINSGRLAGQLREQLGHLPAHKIPSKHDLEQAFRRGELRP